MSGEESATGGSAPGDISDSTVWKEAGDAHFHKGEFESACTCYTHAIELDPRYEAAWNNLGLSLSKAGKIDDAKLVSARLKMLREKKTHVDPGISPVADLPEFSKKSAGIPPRKKKFLYLFSVILIVALMCVVFALVTGMSQTTCARCQGVMVTLAPTHEGFNLTWHGGTDQTLVTGWKAFDRSSGTEVLLFEKMGNTPTVGQVDRYVGGSLAGKDIVIRVWFSDGSEQVIYERQF